jgi:hypothetical protein
MFRIIKSFAFFSYEKQNISLFSSWASKAKFHTWTELAPSNVFQASLSSFVSNAYWKKGSKKEKNHKHFIFWFKVTQFFLL